MTPTRDLYGLSGAGHARRGLLARGRRRGDEGKVEPEDAAGVGGLVTQGAAAGLCQSLADVEAEAEAGLSLRITRALEALEQQRAGLGRHSDAEVAHADARAAVARDADLQAIGLGTVLHGVAEHIDEDLLHTLRVRLD